MVASEAVLDEPATLVWGGGRVLLLSLLLLLSILRVLQLLVDLLVLLGLVLGLVLALVVILLTLLVPLPQLALLLATFKFLRRSRSHRQT